MTEKAIATTEPVAATENETPTTREERRYLAPPVDIYETSDGLAVVADMPGVDPSGLEVKVDSGILTLVGHVTREAEGDPSYREFRLTDYHRQFRLHQQVDVERISAELKHGVLRVTLPHRAEARPRQIEVRVG